MLGLNFKMSGLQEQIVIGLRLNFRNKMALIYGYMFPTIFLVAFWVLYRNERVPMALHMGELLTVTILGGACLGFPTTMVGERERGIWRRYRLMPVPTRNLVAGALVTRFFILITAGLLQLGLALAIGMPVPQHPLGLCIVFTFVAFAFLGLGLEIAMLADNVPAVQALGQCIFLPMLIIGGVAVKISSLPAWAQHVSAFCPGRYAVDALQACFTGAGVTGARFDLPALALTGIAGGLAGIGMFRWDARQRFANRRGKQWIGVGLAAWAAVGLVAELRGRAAVASSDAVARPVSSDYLTQRTPEPATPATENMGPAPIANASTGRVHPVLPTSWQAVTPHDIDDVAFERLPPDGGVVAPIVRLDVEPDPTGEEELDILRNALPEWAPGLVTDPVQRVRNILYVAAVPDVLEMESVEGFIPAIIYARLLDTVPREDLIKILFWIGIHPTDGDDSAAGQLQSLGLPEYRGSASEARSRTVIYALKLLGRLTGKIAPR